MQVLQLGGDELVVLFLTFLSMTAVVHKGHALGMEVTDLVSVKVCLLFHDSSCMILLLLLVKEQESAAVAKCQSSQTCVKSYPITECRRLTIALLMSHVNLDTQVQRLSRSIPQIRVSRESAEVTVISVVW